MDIRPHNVIFPDRWRSKSDCQGESPTYPTYRAKLVDQLQASVAKLDTASPFQEAEALRQKHKAAMEARNAIAEAFKDLVIAVGLDEAFAYCERFLKGMRHD